MSRPAPSPRDRVRDALSLTVCIAIGCLVALTWLTPTEGATQGDSVPRALAWLALASAWPLFTARSASDGVIGFAEQEDTPSLALRAVTAERWIDLGVKLFIGGHVLSGLMVLLTTGQQRHAANLLMEWFGLGAAWIVIRNAVAIPAWRSALTATLLALATAAAGLGIWQHQVSLPALSRELGPKITAVREAVARGESHPFMTDLAAAGVPTTEPGLTLYEKRLRDSREPFAMFALANTLGGLLASALVWAAGVLIGQRGPRTGRWWLGVTCCGVMAACLVLTKSRTASLAALIGFCLIGWQRYGGSRRRLVLGGAVGLCAAVIVAAGAFAVGVWDREVLAEAPKSLGYRWLYWRGTGRLIAEHPIAGVGLGQFRPAYLRVKLPEASEEIADPHNLILEAWVNGGLLAVFGLLVIGIGVWRGGWVTSVGQDESASPTTSHDPRGGSRKLDPPYAEVATAESSNTRIAWGVIGGGGLAFGGVLFAGPWNDAVAAMAVGWVGALAVWWPMAGSVDRFAPRAALVALAVHGLGAGGGSMPAVLLWGLILLAMLPTHTVVTPLLGSRMIGLAPAAVALGAGLFLWRPDVQATRLLAAGDRAALQGRLDDAERFYARAMTADPWNPDPAGRSAELRRREMDSSTSPLSEDRAWLLDECLAHYQAASRRDPANGQWDHAAGEVERRFGRPEAALEMFEQASRKSPTNAAWLADWADAAHAAGRDDLARDAASRALQQDDLNRRLGHVERWLPAARRRELEAWMPSQPGAPATE